jgi:CobQ-like glutamine amidotransferase family enzyme
VESGVVLLAVCGAYQLFGRFYRESTGAELPGVGIFDLHTEHPGEKAKRLTGNIVVEWEGQTIVGFENHGGRTILGPETQPLAQVRTGHGNNGVDGFEGAVYRYAFGTYIHGSLLPKNPSFADHLITLALRRRHGDVVLEAIDDRVELQAHAAALRLRP